MKPTITSYKAQYKGLNCAHAQKTISLAPIHSFIKQIIPSRIGDLKSFDIHDTSFLHAPYKLLLSIKKYFRCLLFFLVSLFHFHHTVFRGLAGGCVNPGCFSLFVHSLVYQITHSFLNRFQPTFVSALLPYMLNLSYYFQPEVNT